MIMAQITITPAALAILKQKELTDKTLLLITDDAGGKYSIDGGACSIGGKFSIIIVDELEPQYDIKLEGPEGINFYTSNYDMTFLGDGLKLDAKYGALRLSNSNKLLDTFLGIADAKDILAYLDDKSNTEVGNC